MTLDLFLIKPQWSVVEEGYHPGRELEVEALLTVSNGYAGTRGTLFEKGSPLGPGTLVAGIFDRVPGDSEIPALVAAPDWVRLRLEVFSPDHECSLNCGTLIGNRRVLDMERALMWRELRHEDPEGRITWIRGFRFISQADRHLFVQSLQIKPENYSGRIRIEAEAELYQTNLKSYLNPYPKKVTVLQEMQKKPGNPAVVNYTYPNGSEIVFAAASRLRGGQGAVIYPEISRIANRVAEHWEFDVEVGQEYSIDRLIAVHTSRDRPKPAQTAREHLHQAWENDVPHHLQAHSEKWKKRWSVSDIRIDGDPESEKALRFAMYGLLSAANPEDESVSIGARALTGNSYLGHVFWDTEIFMMPFFMFTAPDIARSLLMYRYRTLPGARKNAQKNGYAGAMFAWESADTGEETTPSSMLSANGERIRVLTGEQEHHITADVAYAVWQYCLVSGDESFRRGPGAEILIETARFWASRAKLGDDGKYHIENAIGPDEYHEGISDNAFTNEMARWNLQEALRLTQDLSRHHERDWRTVSGRVSFDPKEIELWEEVSDGLVEPRLSDDVFEQFRGFFELEDVKAKGENQPGGADFRIFLDLERLKNCQLIKQADVIMWLYLFWDRFTVEQRAKNFDYYEARTLHGSSLSPAIYSLVAARLGNQEKAFRYFRMSADIDLKNNMNNASGGVHSAAQGGLWQAAVFGFGGLRIHSEGLSFDPKLPLHWKNLSFRLFWRGQQLEVSAANERVSVVNHGALSVSIQLGNLAPVQLGPRQNLMWDKAGGDRWQEVR